MSQPAQKMLQQLTEQQILVKQALRMIKKKDLSELSLSDLNAQFNVLIANNKKKLDFSEAKFGLLDYPPETLQAIFKFIIPPYETITTLDLSDNEIHELDSSQFKVLTDALAISNIKILTLAGDKIFEMESAQLRNFFYQILKNEQLEELDLIDVGLDAIESIEDLKFVFDLIGQHRNLRVLKLCANGIGSLTKEYLAAIFKPLSKSPLLKLDLSDNDLVELTTNDINLVFSNLSKSNIRRLDMQDNRLSDMQSPLLLTVLSHIESSQITSLGLEGNELETNQCFLSKLATNPKLTETTIDRPDEEAYLPNASSPSQHLQSVVQGSSALPAAMELEAKDDVEVTTKPASKDLNLSSQQRNPKVEDVDLQLQKNPQRLDDNASKGAAAAASPTPLLMQYDLRKRAAQNNAECAKSELAKNTRGADKRADKSKKT